MSENEFPRACQRRPLKERQISPLPRHKIEGSMKPLDMVLRYRNYFDHACRLGNVSIPPLAEWPQNNYLGTTPFDNGLI